MSRIFWLLTGAYRVVWRTCTVQWMIGRVRLTARIWGNDDAVFLITSARKHAVAPLLRALGASVAADADIETHLVIHNARNALRDLTIGSACHIGKRVFLDLSAPICLEPHSTLSMNVTLLTHIDVGRTPLRDNAYPPAYGPITIGEGAYIGANATILHGVRIGRHAVVAAGALVREDVPDNTVVGGVPARPLKQIPPSAE
jgi:acetyltransferase-like isoleucine patch superfamily enzyme